MLRVVVDAMVWVSAVTGTHPESVNRAILDAWLRDEFLVITSVPLLKEVERVLLEYLKQPDNLVEEFVSLFLARAEHIFVAHQVMGCKDPNDDPVLETAVTGKANYIVTRDKRLLYLEPPIVAAYIRTTRHTNPARVPFSKRDIFNPNDDDVDLENFPQKLAPSDSVGE